MNQTPTQQPTSNPSQTPAAAQAQANVPAGQAEPGPAPAAPDTPDTPDTDTEYVNPTVKIDPAKPVRIPSDYAALGVKSGYDPLPVDEIRMFLIGPPGSGKTSFVSSIPDTLVLDAENGARAVPAARAARIYIKSHDQLLTVLEKLVADGKAGRRPFKRIVFDTVDQIIEIFAAYLADLKGVEHIGDYGSRGAGYFLLRNHFWTWVERLESAGYCWTIVGHQTEKTVNKPGTNREETVTRPVVFDTIQKVIFRNCEIYATITPINEQSVQTYQQTLPGGRKVNRQRTVHTTAHKMFLADIKNTGAEIKRRGVPNLQTMIDLPIQNGWDVFADVYNKAVQSLTKLLKGA